MGFSHERGACARTVIRARATGDAEAIADAETAVRGYFTETEDLDAYIAEHYPPKPLDRWQSRDPQHYADDLSSALTTLYGFNTDDPEVEELVANLLMGKSPQQVLRTVDQLFGPGVFGAVLLFSIAAQTSLMGHAEALTSEQALGSIGITMADLQWPHDMLKSGWEHFGGAPTPANLQRWADIREGIAVWQDQHPA